ncbi:ATPase, F1/V1/A1 complex, alpha/beta subunit [Tanacetum coccineum]
MSYYELREIDGLNHVLENGPWMVIIDRREPEVLPCWIKLCNVPMEAWTVKGINAIASGLGKPLIMDKTTARMCKDGTGNKFKENIEICAIRVMIRRQNAHKLPGTYMPYDLVKQAEGGFEARLSE